MIKKIRLKNFYSFVDAEINFDAGASVLVGINGSGKSNLLKAIRLLKEGVAGMGLRKYVIDVLGGMDNIISKIPNIRDGVVELEFLFDHNKISSPEFAFESDIWYTIKLKKIPNLLNYSVHEVVTDVSGNVFLDLEDGVGFIRMLDIAGSAEPVWSSYRYTNHRESMYLVLSTFSDTQRDPWLSNLKFMIDEIVVYEYFDTTPKSQIRKAIISNSEKRLLTDGVNLAQTLNTIKINSKPSYNMIISKLADANPYFKGIDFNVLGRNIDLMFEEENFDSSIHVSSISDGTLRYLCLLSILYNPNRGRFICIDEPEGGLHPDMLFLIGNAMLEVSEETSFLITTHSETLLNCFAIEQIRVIEKDSTNSSIVSEYSKEDFAGWYDHFSTGKMWRAGDFGGNR